MKRSIKILIAVAALLVLCAGILAAVNLTVFFSARDKIEPLSAADGYEYAIILGAKVHEGGVLSDMLRDRNDLTHDYDGEIVKEVCKRLINCYLALLEEFRKTAETRYLSTKGEKR